jgi:hypothetical protein
VTRLGQLSSLAKGLARFQHFFGAAQFRKLPKQSKGKPMNNRTHLILVFGWLSLGVPALADILELKDGTTLKGSSARG